MSKSVLVIDTPEKCDSCMYIGTFHDFCRINCRDIKDASVKPDWCPLKPLPEKKEYVDPTSSEKAKKNIIAVGWNTCINMIVKGDSDD